MKISDIINHLNEDAVAGSTMAGNIASVNFPLFGDKKMIRRAVDPNGYLGDGKQKKRGTGYVHPVKVRGNDK
jgi:hypothetical protein